MSTDKPGTPRLSDGAVVKVSRDSVRVYMPPTPTELAAIRAELRTDPHPSLMSGTGWSDDKMGSMVALVDQLGADLAAEREALTALRVRIAGLPALVAADIEAMPISDEARRPMWAIHDEMCARVLSLLTPDPEPRVCRCGTPESDEAWEEGAGGCPKCGRPWPKCLTAPDPEPSTGDGS